MSLRLESLHTSKSKKVRTAIIHEYYNDNENAQNKTNKSINTFKETGEIDGGECH